MKKTTVTVKDWHTALSLIRAVQTESTRLNAPMLHSVTGATPEIEVTFQCESDFIPVIKFLVDEVMAGE